jgi:hypothetical protein
MRYLSPLSVLAFLLAPPLVFAKDEVGGHEFFEKKIRPVLEEHCFKCHSADAEKANKLRGGLLLDSKAALLAGGDTGPLLEPRFRDLLLLVERVTEVPQPPA